MDSLQIQRVIQEQFLPKKINSVFKGQSETLHNLWVIMKLYKIIQMENKNPVFLGRGTAVLNSKLKASIL